MRAEKSARTETKRMSDDRVVTFSETAEARIRSYIDEDDTADLAVRVSVQSASPVAPEYEMALIEP